MELSRRKTATNDKKYLDVYEEFHERNGNFQCIVRKNWQSDISTIHGRVATEFAL